MLTNSLSRAHAMPNKFSVCNCRLIGKHIGGVQSFAWMAMFSILQQHQLDMPDQHITLHSSCHKPSRQQKDTDSRVTQHAARRQEPGVAYMNRAWKSRSYHENDVGCWNEFGIMLSLQIHVPWHMTCQWHSGRNAYCDPFDHPPDRSDPFTTWVMHDAQRCTLCVTADRHAGVLERWSTWNSMDMRANGRRTLC